MRIRLYGRDADDVRLGCDLLGAALRQAGVAARVDGGGAHGDGHLVDAVVVLDPDLLAEVAGVSLTRDAVLYVNAPAAPCSRLPHADRVLAADAAAVARRHGLDSRVATAMIGVFAGASGVLPLDTVRAAAAGGGRAGGAHLAALVEGFGLGRGGAPGA